jgi:hypothetical protein
LSQQTEIIPPKKLNLIIMKKYTLAALFFAASLSVVSAATGAELSLPVNIESVGKLKYMVSVQGKAGATVIIYDSENNEIHKENISSKILFNLAGLADGNYRMVVLDIRKNVISSKSFKIKTEVKRDIVAMN